MKRLTIQRKSYLDIIKYKLIYLLVLRSSDISLEQKGSDTKFLTLLSTTLKEEREGPDLNRMLSTVV